MFECSSFFIKFELKANVLCCYEIAQVRLQFADERKLFIGVKLMHMQVFFRKILRIFYFCLKSRPSPQFLPKSKKGIKFHVNYWQSLESFVRNSKFVTPIIFNQSPQWIRLHHRPQSNEMEYFLRAIAKLSMGIINLRNKISWEISQYGKCFLPFFPFTIIFPKH